MILLNHNIEVTKGVSVDREEKRIDLKTGPLGTPIYRAQGDEGSGK